MALMLLGSKNTTVTGQLAGDDPYSGHKPRCGVSGNALSAAVEGSVSVTGGSQKAGTSPSPKSKQETGQRNINHPVSMFQLLGVCCRRSLPRFMFWVGLNEGGWAEGVTPNRSVYTTWIPQKYGKRLGQRVNPGSYYITYISGPGSGNVPIHQML